MGSSLEFRLLGPVEAMRGGESLSLGGSRQRALLALLLLDWGRPVSTDRLADELWDGQPPAGAATTLRSYVSRLRNVLGADAPVASSPAGYALEVAPEQIDVHLFESLTREGEEALARRRARRARVHLLAALELWRGSPFAGLADGGALRVEADRLEELRQLALEGRIEADLALGSGSDLVDELEALVREHPYRERLWRHLMLALYRAERQADALAAYGRAREILDAELGLEPSEELRQLEQAILRHEVPPAARADARHLPSPTTSFVGREAELTEVEQRLEEGRLVTLTGVGGVGKTRLALEVASRVGGDFPDGVYFVDFAPLADAGLVARHVAAELEVAEQPDKTVEEQLATRLRDADLLLVLDNCEHVRAACAELIETLLGAAPSLRILATSRETLGAPGEVDLSVPPLTLPDGVQLFVTRARASRSSLDESEQVFEAAARICRDLDGLPLAIELAAARAKALSLDEIATRLADRFRFLVSWRRLTAARHRTLREAMDWSYELLSDEEQAVLAHLSVFAGGFTLAAAAAVCLEGDDERALELVGRLVDASLVVAEEHGDHMRYRLLETVRQYAAGKLQEDPVVAEDASRAHGSFFAELVDEGDARRPDEAQGTLIDDDLENFRAAIDGAAGRRDVETELRLVGGLWRYWWVRGYLDEGRRRIDDALARRADVDGPVLARALIGGAGLAYTQGEYARARTLAAQALEETRAAGSTSQEVVALNTLGVTAMRQGEYDAARRYLEESLALADRLGLVDVVAAKLNLGVVALEAGEPSEAVPFFEEVLVYHRQHRWTQGIGFACLNLGQALFQLGEQQRARESFEEARAAFADIGFRAHVGHALQGLAGVEANIGSPEEAARLLGRADSMLSEVGAAVHDFEPELAATAEVTVRAQIGDVAFAAAFEEGRLSSMPD